MALCLSFSPWLRSFSCPGYENVSFKKEPRQVKKYFANNLIPIFEMASGFI